MNPLDLPILFSDSCLQHQDRSNSLASPPKLLTQSLYKSCQNPPQQVLVYDRNDSVAHTINRPFALFFSGNFECGNIEKVYLIEGGIQYLEETYDIYIKTNGIHAMEDVEDYFLFRIQNNRKNKRYKFNIKNINSNSNNQFKRNKITAFSQGLKPVMLSLNENENNKIGWNNIIDTSYESNVLSFSITFNYANDTIYIGKCVPYTYSHLTNVLSSMALNPQINNLFDTSLLTNASSNGNVNMIHIHYGNRNDNNKPTILIVGRMNANDHLSSWLIDGLMKKLLDSNSISNYIRDNYQFMIIPMINIDGCVNGYNNINKSLQSEWCSPSIPYIHSIHKVKELCVQLHCRKQFAGYLEILGSNDYAGTNGVFTYAVEHNPASTSCLDSCHLISNLIESLTVDYNINETYFANFYGNNNTKNLLNMSSMKVVEEFGLQLACAIQCAPFKPIGNHQVDNAIQYSLYDVIHIGEQMANSLLKLLKDTEDSTNVACNHDTYKLENLSTANLFKRDDFVAKPYDHLYSLRPNSNIYFSLNLIGENPLKINDSPPASPLSSRRSKPATPLSPRLSISPSLILSRSSTPSSPTHSNNNKMYHTRDLDLGSPSKAITDSIFTGDVNRLESNIVSINIKPKVLCTTDNISIENNDAETKASDAIDIPLVNYGPGSALYQYKRRAITSHARNRCAHQQYVLDPNYNEHNGDNSINNSIINEKGSKSSYGQFRRQYLAIPEFIRPLITPSLRAQEKKKELSIRNNTNIHNNNTELPNSVALTTRTQVSSNSRPKSAFTKISVSPFKENKPEKKNEDSDKSENMEPINNNITPNTGLKVDLNNCLKESVVSTDSSYQKNIRISILKHAVTGSNDIEIEKLAPSNVSNQSMDLISHDKKADKILSSRPPETVQSSNNRNVHNMKHRNIVCSDNKRPKSALRLKIVNLF